MPQIDILPHVGQRLFENTDQSGEHWRYRKSSGKIMKQSNPKWHPATKRDAARGGQSCWMLPLAVGQDNRMVYYRIVV